MALSPKIFGVTTKPTDPTPAVAQQTFFAPECTTPVTYPWLNEFIQNFLNSQAYLGIPNLPNDDNALKKMFEKVIEKTKFFQSETISYSGIIPDADFKYWPISGAVATKIRVEQCNAGGNIVRAGYAEGCTAYKIEEVDSNGGGIRLQRNNTDSSTATLRYIINLFDFETDPLRGQDVGLMMSALKSNAWSGNQITAKLIYSEEPMQPIILDNGMYSNGNVILATMTIAPTTEYPEEEECSFLTATLPPTATQCAIVIEVPFSGTAGSEDYVQLKFIKLDIATERFFRGQVPFSDVLQKSKMVYQTSTNIGVADRTPEKSGAISAIATDETVNFGVEIPVKFETGFPIPPTLYLYAPVTAQDFEMYEDIIGLSVPALVFYLSTSGATVTNNGYIHAGARCSVHYSAILRGY